jgi:hypothetical protein
MPNHTTHRKKPMLTEHQKRIRLLTGLSMAVCWAFAFAFFWYFSRPSFLSH